ncbi:TPA: integrase [Citrobacter farmeri]|nr:integrase [Citrobacter farmeri]HEM8561609.1 integrase [Citrobacter farmeri]
MLRIGQVETTATSDGLYTDGSVAGGIAATRLRASAFNAMQEELAHIVEEGGDALSIDDMTQVLKALKKLFLSRSNPFGDIALDGPEAIALALSNLRLGAGAFPIGMPFFWPSPQTPDKLLPQWEGQVFLKWNDATFSATQYPLLALIIPSLRLSEARGEFPRIWDDGRGVDSGRALLSVQGDAIRNITGSFYSRGGNATSSGAISIASGVFSFDGSATGDSSATLTVATSPQKPLEATRFSADAVVPTANENRSRNIAFNFLVRAK